LVLAINRRRFVGALGVAAFGLPLAVRAQIRRPPVIGFLGSTTERAYVKRLAAFHRGLKELGFEAGQNVTIDYRWGEGRYDRLGGLAAELARNHVAVLVAGDGPSIAARQDINNNNSDCVQYRIRPGRFRSRQQP
jgi:putative tryptophan/tyrosine transport system substrate-binding protein